MIPANNLNYSNMHTKKTAQIKELLEAERYDMKDFWQVCPYTPSELIAKNRKHNIKCWRQVGMVWMHLSGKSSSQAAIEFKRDHVTVLHAENIIIDTLEGYGDETIRQILNMLKDQTLYWVPMDDEICINEAICMVILDQSIGDRIREREAAQERFNEYITKKKICVVLS